MFIKYQSISQSNQPVESDEHDGAGGEVHRNGERREDGAAERRAQVPAVGELVVQLDRQTEHAQRQVRQRQTRHEHVRRRLRTRTDMQQNR